jgi:hypothetical protein
MRYGIHHTCYIYLGTVGLDLYRQYVAIDAQVEVGVEA